MQTSFYTQEELSTLGLSRYGHNILISRKVSIYGAEQISIGNHVRIDDFCILSGKIEIGSYVHIAAFCALYASQGIIINDFAGLSARVTIYSAIDNFSGEFLIGPMIPDEFRNVLGGAVVLQKYVQIGSGSVILPNLILGEGAAIGAMSLVVRDIDAWTINVGIPAKFLKKRQQRLLQLSKKLCVS